MGNTAARSNNDTTTSGGGGGESAILKTGRALRATVQRSSYRIVGPEKQRRDKLLYINANTFPYSSAKHKYGAKNLIELAEYRAEEKVREVWLFETPQRTGYKQYHLYVLLRTSKEYMLVEADDDDNLTLSYCYNKWDLMEWDDESYKARPFARKCLLHDRSVKSVETLFRYLGEELERLWGSSSPPSNDEDEKKSDQDSGGGCVVVFDNADVACADEDEEPPFALRLYNQLCQKKKFYGELDQLPAIDPCFYDGI